MDDHFLSMPEGERFYVLAPKRVCMLPREKKWENDY
jgi:hypothetical protein